MFFENEWLWKIASTASRLATLLFFLIQINSSYLMGCRFGSWCLRRQLLALTKGRTTWSIAWALSTRLTHHLLLNLACHSLKCHVDVLCRLSRCLNERHTKLRRKFLTFLEGYLTAVLHITFVPHEDLADTSLRIFLNFIDPGADIVKGLSIGHIVHYYDSLGATIIWSCESAESFLASGIPDLQLYDILLMLDRLELKIDANCVEEVLVKRVLRIT